MDLGGDKQAHPSISGEANPALGMRAICDDLRHPHLFTSQLTALLRAGVYGDVRIMLSMISNVGELLAAKALWERVKAKLVRQQIPHRSNVPIGMMIEVPSAIWIADILAP